MPQLKSMSEPKFKKLTLKIVGVSKVHCRLDDGTIIKYGPSILREIEGDELDCIVEFLRSNRGRLTVAEGYYKSGKAFSTLGLGEEEAEVEI